MLSMINAIMMFNIILAVDVKPPAIDNYESFLVTNGVKFDKIVLSENFNHLSIIKESVVSNENFVQIPQETLLWERNLEKSDPDFAKLIKKLNSDTPSEIRLTLYLLNEISKGTQSPYAPVLSTILPPKNILSEWSDKELHLFQDERLHYLATSHADHIKEIYRYYIKPFLTKHSKVLSNTVYTETKFQEIYNYIQAYSIHIHHTELFIPPLLTTFLHGNIDTISDFDMDHNGLYRIHLRGDGYNLSTSNPVHYKYGEYNNDHILISYGYVILDNQYEKIHLENLIQVANQRHMALRDKLLYYYHHLNYKDEYPLKRLYYPFEAIAVYRFLKSPQEELRILGSIQVEVENKNHKITQQLMKHKANTLHGLHPDNDVDNDEDNNSYIDHDIVTKDEYGHIVEKRVTSNTLNATVISFHTEVIAIDTLLTTWKYHYEIFNHTQEFSQLLQQSYYDIYMDKYKYNNTLHQQYNICYDIYDKLTTNNSSSASGPTVYDTNANTTTTTTTTTTTDVSIEETDVINLSAESTVRVPQSPAKSILSPPDSNTCIQKSRYLNVIKYRLTIQRILAINMERIMKLSEWMNELHHLILKHFVDASDESEIKEIKDHIFTTQYLDTTVNTLYETSSFFTSNMSHRENIPLSFPTPSTYSVLSSDSSTSENSTDSLNKYDIIHQLHFNENNPRIMTQQKRLLKQYISIVINLAIKEFISDSTRFLQRLKSKRKNTHVEL